MVQETKTKEELKREEEKKKQENQILIEDGTLATFGLENLSECSVR